jgi:REP element-mobilizing transposase RayT
LIWACAILPDHVHLVLAKHRLKVESLVIQLKGDATEQLISQGRHPFAGCPPKNGRPPKCFARGEWKVYLESVDEIERAIEYVEKNPLKEQKPRQKWNFVTKFV